MDAETPQDAEREARLLLAHDRHHRRQDMSDDGHLTSDRDWEVAEVNQI